MNKLINDLTYGSVPKTLARLCVPFMLSNGLQVLYSLVDMIVVGRFVGSAGLSAASVSSRILLVATMLCMGYSTGGQVLIAQVVGSGRRDKLNKTIGTMFSLVLLMGAAVSLFAVIFCDGLLSLVRTPAEAYEMASGYLLICGGGMVFTYGYNMVSAALRGMGDSSHPFIFILIASGVNVVLDLFFVGALGWGLAGAAWATIIGQMCSFLLSMAFLYRHREEFCFDFKPRSFLPDRKTAAKLTSLGLPFALQNCAINVSILFVNALVNGIDVTASAVFGVGLKLDDVINSTTKGILFGVSSFTGQNIAAGEYERVRGAVRWGWVFSFSCFAIFTAAYLLESRWLFGIFTTDKRVVALAPVFVSAAVWSFPAMASMRGTMGLMQGVGNAKLCLILGVLDGAIFRTIFSYLFGTIFGLGLYGYCLGFGVAAYGTAIPGLIYFLSGRWRKVQPFDSLR